MIGVVGASARAAVHSLARAGYTAWACDLFADRDLKQIASCAVCPFDSFPDALPALAAQFPASPVLYTGGLENHPRVVAELAAKRELWGNPPSVLEQVRDPFRLHVAIGTIPAPMVVPDGEACPASGRWLRKPRHSSAGHGIHFAQPGEEPSHSHYFQEFIDGTPMSAVYFNDTLFGVTEQLIGEAWLHAKLFAYCGNIGPFPVRDELVDLGARLQREFSLRSVWNLDFIARGNAVYPVEVNPRYSASVEVLEHATGTAAFSAPSPNPLPPGERGLNLSPPSLLGKRIGGLSLTAVGKAIYYAPHRFEFPPAGPWDADLSLPFDPWRLPDFADIPEPGSVIEAGWPVLTIFSAGSSRAECRELLQSRAAELDQLFSEATP